MNTLCHHPFEFTIVPISGVDGITVTFDGYCPTFRWIRSLFGRTLYLTVRHSSEQFHPFVSCDGTPSCCVPFFGIRAVFVRRGEIDSRGSYRAVSQEYRPAPGRPRAAWELVATEFIDDAY